MWGRNPTSTVASAGSKRVLVTGSRGKSSVVRLLHAALTNAGVIAYGRITGVVPRELGPGGARNIARSTPGHVEEMHWWLGRLPADTQAVVMENSAISPELQHLAGQWLRPDITVLTNTLADHQEAWGRDPASAAEALSAGIPIGGRVLLPSLLAADGQLMKLLGKRGCEILFAGPVDADGTEHRAGNLGLALEAAVRLGLEPESALTAMRDLPADLFDFRVLDCGSATLAQAFSANDIASSRALFESLQWPKHQTRVLYNHRSDRPARLRSFLGWLNDPAWKEVTIIGDRPMMRTGLARYARARKPANLLGLLHPGERVFGCGNIAGLPLSLVMEDGRVAPLTT